MKPLRLKSHHFHSKLLCQKPMLRQIDWQLQNGPITEWNFASNYLNFWKIRPSFRTSWKELIWSTNDPNANIRIFRNCWSLILGCFSLWVSLICSFHEIFSSNITANLINFCLIKTLLTIFKSGNFKGRSSLVLFSVLVKQSIVSFFNVQW